MKKLLVGISLITALAVVALAATTSVRYRTFTGPIFLSTEIVDYAGVVHAVAQVPGNSCAPTDPCRLFVNLAGVNGVGQSSGGVYQFVGAANVTIDNAIPGVATSVIVRGFRAVPPNPIAPVDPCRVRLDLILDGQGGATVADARLEFDPPCGVDGCLP